MHCNRRTLYIFRIKQKWTKRVMVFVRWSGWSAKIFDISYFWNNFGIVCNLEQSFFVSFCGTNIRMSRRNRNQSQANNLNVSTPSQSSQSSRRGNQSFSPSSQGDGDYEQHTAATVKFILNHMTSKYPIKRTDLVKECCNGNSRIFPVILSAVQNHLKSVSVSLPRTK